MLEHDVKRWGPLRAAAVDRPRLVRVLALIQELARVDDRALPDAARIVVDRVADAQLDLFMLNTAGDAAAVGQADKLNRVWSFGHCPIMSFWDEPEPPGDFFHGPAGMLEWMRKFWVNDADVERDWNDYSGAPLAILESAAMVLFPAVFGDEVADDPEAAGPGAEGLPVVQPVGGAWPHDDRQVWTEAEREALFLMRHRDKKKGDELARIAGVSRQRIDEVIGPARPGGSVNRAAGKDGWTPSAELLKACGVPLQPLQKVAATSH